MENDSKVFAATFLKFDQVWSIMSEKLKVVGTTSSKFLEAPWLVEVVQCRGVFWVNISR